MEAKAHERRRRGLTVHFVGVSYVIYEPRLSNNVGNNNNAIPDVASY